MPKGHRLETWEVNRLAALVESGQSNRQIAQEMLLNPATVQRWRKAHEFDKFAGNGTAHAPAHEQTAEEAVIQVYVESTDYPVIKALISKQQKYRAMSRQAEDMGDDDLSLLIMSRMELTPLEQEILRYWAEQHARDN